MLRAVLPDENGAIVVTGSPGRSAVRIDVKNVTTISTTISWINRRTITCTRRPLLRSCRSASRTSSALPAVAPDPVAVSTGGQFLRGLIAGAFGLMLAFVGYDSVTGGTRFTLGTDYLWDGISLVPALTGLFAISEMIALSVSGGTISSEARSTRIVSVLDGVRAVFVYWKTLLQGSVIGTVIGAIPGLGGTVAAFLSYTAAQQISKHPETFGKGNIEGVIGPEAANNAKDGGSLIPTLALAFPVQQKWQCFSACSSSMGWSPDRCCWSNIKASYSA